MKIYFRLLSYAKPLSRFAWPYVFFTILAVVFGTLNLALLAPLLTVLFNKKGMPVAPPAPGSSFNLFDSFSYYAQHSIEKFGEYKTLQIVCLVIVGSVFLSNVFRYLSERTIENLRIYTLLNLRKAVFENVMNLHLGYFNSQRKGDIISKISSDVQVVQYTVTGTLQVLFKEPLTLIAYLVMLFSISYKLTLFSLLIIPLSGLIIARIVKKLKEQATASHESYGNMISYLDEALHGMRVVQAFNAVPFVKERFHAENKRYSSIIRNMIKRQQMASPVSETLGVLLVTGIVLYGGSLVLSENGLSGPTFIAYIALFSQVMRPAKAISNSFTQIHTGITAGERILALIDEKPEIFDQPDAIEKQDFEDRIQLQNVSFAYGENEVLHRINLTITKGTTVALVGPSGGGKSTLMDLFPRFIDPSAGAVLLDGENIQRYSLHSLRALMGVVGQDSILFNDTIFNNIAFGKKDCTEAQVIEAARIANAHDFIMAQKNGYQTNIGDRGLRLSGGQRQRICIARAILQNPPIMLLDEATSALDTESEKIVQQSLDNLMKNRTSIVIAHRLSTIQKADMILVLDNGEIVEIGHHDDLMTQNGLYKRLVEMQSFSTQPLAKSEAV